MDSGWKQFVLTGSVEDYLNYRQKKGKKLETPREQIKGCEYGTDGGCDRAGFGGIPLRGL